MHQARSTQTSVAVSAVVAAHHLPSLRKLVLGMVVGVTPELPMVLLRSGIGRRCAVCPSMNRTQPSRRSVSWQGTRVRGALAL